MLTSPEAREHSIDFLGKKWVDMYEDIGYKKILYPTNEVDINNLL